MNNDNSDILADLAKPSFLRFLPYLVGDWFAIFCGLFLFNRWPSVFTFLASSVVIGISQHALFILGHDGVHYSMARNRTLSEWITRLFCLFPLGMTVSSYREFHFAHHRDVKGATDPEVPILREIGINWQPPFTLSRGLLLWGASFFGYCLRDQWVILKNMPAGNRKEKLYLLCFSIVLVGIAIKTQYLLLLGLWQFSLFTGHLSTFRIETWYEHSLKGVKTNRYEIPNPVFRLLVPHNIWVHYEHHKYPNIPFYNLELVRALDDSEKIYTYREMVAELSTQNNHLDLSKAA